MINSSNSKNNTAVVFMSSDMSLSCGHSLNDFDENDSIDRPHRLIIPPYEFSKSHCTNNGRPSSASSTSVLLSPLTPIPRNASKLVYYMSLLAFVLVSSGFIGCVSVMAKGDSNIGDRMRSNRSSLSFFQFVDRDGDGEIQKGEVANFLQNVIGGTSFDTSKEIEVEVQQVMEELDHGSKGLDKNDIYDHWAKLETLLTVDEVADWVVYALQLPESIGQIFRENGVTGYDFPELVDNDGEQLKTELGIEKQSFQKKILRNMQARMMGVGSYPKEPKGFKHHLESCLTSQFTWRKSSARAFAVHSYRIQRRAIPVMKNTCRKTDSGTGECSVQKDTLDKTYKGEWETVYVGSDDHFVDTDVMFDHKYKYRIQAWNPMGHSSWTELDISPSLKKQGCHAGDSAELTFEESPLRYTISIFFTILVTIKTIVVFLVFGTLSNFLNLLGTVLAIGTMVIRYQRAVAKSTAIPNHAYFSWMYQLINKISVLLTGVDVIPESVIINSKSLRNNDEHDQAVGASRLDGYKSIFADKCKGLMGFDSISYDTGVPMGVGEQDPRGSFFAHKVAMNRKNTALRRSNSTRSLPPLGGNEDLLPIDRRKVMHRSSSTAKLSDSVYEEGSNSANDEPSSRNDRSVITDTPRRKVRFPKSIIKWKKQSNDATVHSNIERNPHQLTASDFEGSISSDEEDDYDWGQCQEIQPLPKKKSKFNRGSINLEEFWSDHTRCNTCGKEYKFGARWKHHCARCLTTFCHRHGKVTHSSLVSCKVPGDCVCNTCLGIMKSQRNLSNDENEAFQKKKSKGISRRFKKTATM